MTNHATGHEAEKAAAAFLKKQGFHVLELNWKTNYCEIDIIARKNNVLYFVEVKHRSSDRQGSGFDYITPKKQQQMTFAAESWMHAHDGEYDCQLAAIASSPEGFEMIEL